MGSRWWSFILLHDKLCLCRRDEAYVLLRPLVFKWTNLLIVKSAQRFSAAPSSFPEPETSLPTVKSVIEDKRKQNEAKVEAEAAAEKKQQESSAKTESAAPHGGATPGSPEALEEEAGQQGAFNPETGEINWDCPCLGGMADGPCGEEFKTAFSCFVYSTEEPKGMDCIEKFSCVLKSRRG